MFSNDKNIETIGQLVEVLKHYVKLQNEYTRLDIVDKVVRLLTVAVMALFVLLIFMIALIYLSFALVYVLEPHTGLVGAFAIVAGAYLILLLLCLIFRKKWIEAPLVKFLANLFMEK